MQRLALVSALASAALLSVPAHATSVTLYGIVDAGIFTEKTKINGVSTDTVTGMKSGGQSGSRWGLRGHEDLGNGLRANFQLESGFNLNNGAQGNNGRLFGRAAWGGLSGNFGDVRFGRQQTVAVSFFGSVSPFGTGWSDAALGNGGFRASATPRFDNSVTYFSPKFSGFQAAAGYSFNTRGSSAPSDNSTRAFSLAARYDQGPIYLALTYDQLDPSDIDPNANGRKPKAVQLGGSYDFDSFKLYAGWSQQKDGWIKSGEGPASGPNNDLGSSAYFDGNVNAYILGASVPLGAGTLRGAFHFVKPDDSAFPGGEDVQVYNVGYDYPMSKRTNLYALASFRDGDLYGFQPDSSGHQIGIGVRHRF